MSGWYRYLAKRYLDVGMIRDQLLNILLAARDTVRIHQVEPCRVLTSDNLFAF